MSAAPSPLGSGLYFIDILACMLFCLTLALVGAHFGREMAVPLELPRLEGPGTSIGELTAVAITLRGEDGATRVYWEEEPVTLEGLRERLQSRAPQAVVVRMEESAFTSVIASAQAAGVRDIQIAYDAARGGDR